MQPRVSVHALTYNHGKYIAQTIEGVLAQKTAFPFELVIGDDCSKDDTREIITRYQRLAPEIIRPVFHEKNLGVTRNTIATFAACSGEYIACLDGDDFWTATDKLQTQVDLLDRQRETAICAHRATLQYEGDMADASAIPYDLSAPYFPTMPAGVYTMDDLVKSDFMPASSIMFRRSAIPEFPDWFVNCFSQDYGMLLLAARTGNIVLLDAAMSTYRIHGSSLRASRSEIFVYQGRIQILESLTDGFEGCRAAVDRSLFDNLYWLTLLLKDAGRETEARRSLRRCLALPAPGSKLRLKALLALRTYAPGAFGLLKRLKPF